MPVHHPTLDRASSLTIGLTLVLFLLALFEKGLTHDLLLEAGVFLVSVKLVLAGYKNGHAQRELARRLDEVKALVETRLPPRGPGGSPSGSASGT